MGKSDNNNKGLSISGVKSSKCGPFIIKVDHFENETWQGRIIWAEENKTERFRSTLELIGLINEAMGKGQEQSFDNTKIL